MRDDIIKIVWRALWAGLDIGYLGDPTTLDIQVSGKPNYVYVAPQVGAREGIVQAFNPFGVRSNQLYLPVRLLTLEDNVTKVVLCVDPFYAFRFALDLYILRSNLDVFNSNAAGGVGTTLYGTTRLELNAHENSSTATTSTGTTVYDLSVAQVWDSLPRPSNAQDGDDSRALEFDHSDGYSGGVPSGWSEVDFATVLTPARDVTTNTYTLAPTASGATRGFSGIYRAWPSFSNGAIFYTYCGISGISSVGTDIQAGGLAIFEDATSSTGDMRVIAIGRNTDAGIIEILAYSLTAYDAVPTVLASAEWHAPAGYLRFRWVSSSGTLYYDYSSDGLNWQSIYNEVLSYTPAHIGLVSSRYKGTYARFSFYREVRGSTYPIQTQAAGQLRYR